MTTDCDMNTCPFDREDPYASSCLGCVRVQAPTGVDVIYGQRPDNEEAEELPAALQEMTNR